MTGFSCRYGLWATTESSFPAEVDVYQCEGSTTQQQCNDCNLGTFQLDCIDQLHAPSSPSKYPPWAVCLLPQSLDSLNFNLNRFPKIP